MDVTWISVADLPDHDASDAFVVDQVAAANHWAFTQRALRGYSDLRGEVPNPAAKSGTIMYAELLIATKGSQSGSAHFEGFDGLGDSGAIGGDMREVRRLLGISRVRAVAVG